MKLLFIIVALLITIDNVMSEIRLAEGEEVTFTFTGPELKIEIDNHDDEGNVFVMCFKSYPNSNANRCPRGYASLYYGTSKFTLMYRFFINRKGELLRSTLTLIVGKIVFGEDGYMTLLMYKLPRACTFRLPNAQKVIPTTTTTTAQITSTVAVVKESSYKTLYFVIGCLALLLVLIIVVGLVCIFLRKKTDATNNQVVPINQSGDNDDQLCLNSTPSTRKSTRTSRARK
uniref:ZP domain-containing protein n=1 Tax=Panagrellus redivivus TaxID=6233 RepID=A0A7E4UR66_PANRE